MIDKPREIALKTLYEIDKNGAYSNIALDEQIKQNKKILSNKDIGFISEVVYGTTTWRLTLDSIIQKHSNLKLKKISTWILNILRMGTYQIVFLDKVPKSAAVNESVNLAKRYGHKSSSNFVNAVLRKVEKKDFEDFEKIENNLERISKCNSMPQWIIEQLLDDGNDIEKVESICKASNYKPKIFIRVNRLKDKKENVKAKLNEYGINAQEAELPDFLALEKINDIKNMKEFKEGKFTVQDEGAGLIPLVLNPKENETILDACSSPGGKTTYIAELMNNKGKIVAWDIHEHRVKLVEENAKRLGIHIIEAELQDATQYLEKYKNYFDKILLDVPCLGIGVLKRKPDIKWQRKKEDIDEITQIQNKILENCSKYLKKNGELVYSTCSIFKKENEGIISKFLEKNKNFEIEKIEKNLSNYFDKFIEKNKFFEIYQNEKTDGFFICKLQKIKE